MSYHLRGVRFTEAQFEALRAFYGTYEDESINELENAQAELALDRAVVRDGLRVMAVLAEYLRHVSDPVDLVKLALQALEEHG